MTPAVVGVASRTLPCGTLVLVNYKGHRLTVPVIGDQRRYDHGLGRLTWAVRTRGRPLNLREATPRCSRV
jgi:hypothetical protein